MRGGRWEYRPFLAGWPNVTPDLIFNSYPAWHYVWSP